MKESLIKIEEVEEIPKRFSYYNEIRNAILNAINNNLKKGRIEASNYLKKTTIKKYVYLYNIDKEFQEIMVRTRKIGDKIYIYFKKLT